MSFEKEELIKTLINEESFSEAVSLLKIEESLNCNDAEIYHYLSLCYFKLDMMNKAYENIDISLNLNSKDISSIILKSQLYYEDGLLGASKEYAECAMNINPKNQDVLIQIAKIALYEERISDAEALINDALEQCPNDYHTNQLLIELYLKQKVSLEKILSVINKLKKIRKSEKLDFYRFQAHYTHENIDECEKIFRLMYRKNPHSKLTAKAREIIIFPNKVRAKNDEQESIETDENYFNTGTKETTTLSEALQKLDEFEGLDSVKIEIKKIVQLVEYNKIREEKLQLSNLEKPSYHFLFTGNPGTGKTTVARILGDIFNALGILEKSDVIEVDRSELVGEYIGQTAVKTKKVIEKAMGGVLFVDEAYTLSKDGGSKNDFGAEAIDTILKAMEDHRDKLIVIFAGYEEEMKNFVRINPGLESRINKKIKFDDFDEKELISIAQKFASKNHYSLTEEAKLAFLKKISEEQVKINFSNARAARNIIENAVQTRAYRLSGLEIKDEDLQILEPEDFGVNISELFNDDLEELMAELNSLEGLAAVKNQIESIINTVRANERRKQLGVNNTNMSLHMMFLGNPGTGKTMIARLVSKLLKSIGVIKRGHLVEVGREDLVAQYIGQTAPKTLNKIREAYGGVLFIDEAYALSSTSHNDFGKEAVSTLIKEMEDNRDKLVVIMAGYTNEMNELLELNSGLKSRIAYEIDFPDYTSEELANIFSYFVKKEQFTLDDDVLHKIERKFHMMSINAKEDFGNARLARQTFERVIMLQSNRIADDKSADPFLISSIDIDNL